MMIDLPRLRTGAWLSVLCVALQASATAQDVSIGVKAGLNRSHNTSQLTPELVKPRMGFHVGASFSIRSSSNFALQLGALYTKKGTDFETGTPDVTGGLELSYLEMPALATILFPAAPASTIVPFVFIGPAISFEVGCDIKGQNQEVTVSGSCTEAGATTRNVDAGVMFGGGIGFDTGPASLALEVAYTLGLVDIDDSTPITDDVKNRNLSFAIGLTFPVRGRGLSR